MPQRNVSESISKYSSARLGLLLRLLGDVLESTLPVLERAFPWELAFRPGHAARDKTAQEHYYGVLFVLSPRATMPHAGPVFKCLISTTHWQRGFLREELPALWDVDPFGL